MTEAAIAQAKARTFYDRIADVHNVALKLNGYRDSVAKYLKSLDLEISPDSMVLDAGSGTGVVTMGFQDAGYLPRSIVTFDISFNSLSLAQEEFRKERLVDDEKIKPVQGDILKLPFADGSFDFIITCGVLEYVPLDEGLKELSRVLKPNAKMVLMPVKPSLIGSILERLYNFKIHPTRKVKKVSQKYFKVVGNHQFPKIEPIAWSKTIFLLKKESDA